jgi:hypothetical protein
MKNYEKILTPSIKRRREVDTIPKENRTWEEKMIYAINHSEIVDEEYFKSDSGEIFLLGDKRLNCLIKETNKILTPNGWVRMGDIKVGDVITGSDGKEQTVLGVYPQGERDVYKVTFYDGTTTYESEGIPSYRSTTIKAKEIGILYDLIEDEFSNKGYIVVKLID